jgi:hypothetical protein
MNKAGNRWLYLFYNRPYSTPHMAIGEKSSGVRKIELNIDATVKFDRTSSTQTTSETLTSP